MTWTHLVYSDNAICTLPPHSSKSFLARSFGVSPGTVVKSSPNFFSATSIIALCHSILSQSKGFPVCCTVGSSRARSTSGPVKY